MSAIFHDVGDEDVLRCLVCGGPLNVSYLGFVVRKHDHKPDNSGLDDGPYLPGCAPRKKPGPKPADVVRDMKLRGWATRRAKYGPKGHQ